MVMQMIKIRITMMKKKMFPVIRCGFKLTIAVMAHDVLSCDLFHMQMQILVTN